MLIVTIVVMLRSRTCKDKDLMQLLRISYFFEAAHQFRLPEMHIAGVDNGLADDLSRNKLEHINEIAAKLNDNPSPIPFLKWLLLPNYYWSS